MQKRQLRRGTESVDGASDLRLGEAESSFRGDNGCSGRSLWDEWCGRVGRRDSGSSSEILVSLMPLITLENSCSASASIDIGVDSATGVGGASACRSGGSVLMG